MRSFPRRKNNSGAPRQRSTKPFHALNKPVFALILLLACGFRWNEASACSTCGCASSGTDFGMLQTWGQHSLGLQYRLDRFDNGVTEEGLSSSDFLSSWNINGIWSPAQRLQIQAQVPLRMQTRITGNDRITRTGLGDSWLLARYAIWQNASDSTDAETWVSVAGGVKLPTGTFRPEESNEGLPVNSQLGTGSVDFLAELRAQIRFTSLAVMGEAVYRHNLSNRDDYRFGHQVSGSADLRWIHSAGSFAYGLSGGFYAEHFGRDSRNQYWRNDTGGNGLYASTGAFATLGSFTTAMRYRIPLVQQYAGGQVTSRGPFDVSLMYQF